MPTLGGRNMLIDAGPLDQRPARALPDYGLIYRGEPLDADLTIAGNVRVTLHVQSDCPDTDFVAKLIEIAPDGRAMLLMDGVMRAMYREPSAGAAAAGARPGLSADDRPRRYPSHVRAPAAASRSTSPAATFPRRARNTNSGNPVLAKDGEAAIRVAHNTVHHAGANTIFHRIADRPPKEPKRATKSQSRRKPGAHLSTDPEAAMSGSRLSPGLEGLRARKVEAVEQDRILI